MRERVQIFYLVAPMNFNQHRRRSSMDNPATLFLSRLMSRDGNTTSAEKQQPQLLKRIEKLFRRKPRAQVLQLPESLHVDVWGLPGDIPSNVPHVICRIIEILAPLELAWCVVGDVLLAHYCVPKITYDIEVCVLPEQLEQARTAFASVPEFCYPFRPRQSIHDSHLAPYPRFRVNGMNQCFYLVTSDHYGLTPEVFAQIIYTPTVLFPLLPLPCFIQGLAAIAAEGLSTNNFISQLEFLIDGVDIDEDWCNSYLTGPALPFVLNMSTPIAKKKRMGTHPKYVGNITTYISNQAERQSVIKTIGRTMESRDLPTSLPTWTGSELSPNTIQCMSDLHLECGLNTNNDQGLGYIFEFKPSSNTLGLLGDVGNVVHEALFKFLHEQLLRFRKVLFVMGNHEFYGSTYDEAKIRMRMFSENVKRQRMHDSVLGEFIFLDRTRHDFDENITILGCTLWSSIPPAASEQARARLKDFKRIKDWTVETHNLAYTAEASWLEWECLKIRREEPNRRIFIFTHHAPLMQGTSAPNNEGSPLACCFATDMSNSSFWGAPVELWAFGHTHYNCDFVKGGVRVVSNQRGYEGIDSHNLKGSFSPEFVLRI